LPAIGFPHQTTGAVLCGHIAAAVLRTVDSLYITSHVTFRDLTKQVDGAR